MKHTLRIVAIVVATVVLLALFFHDSNPREVFHLIASINGWWLTVGLLVNFAALICRAQRWRTLIEPTNPPPYYATFFSVTIGYMSSSILPVRAGDVVRAALMKRKASVRFSTALATVLTERMLDLSAILLLLVYFVIVSITNESFPPRKLLIMKTVGLVAGGILLAMLLFVVGVTFFKSTIRRMHERIGGLLPARFRDPWMHFFETFTKSLALSHYRGAFGQVILLTAITWFLLSAQFFFTLLALGYDLPFRASYLITGASIVGLMIPTPGGVGGFHKACQIALVGFYGFSIDSSVAIAMVFHIVGTAPVILTGLALFASEGLTWSQLSKIGETTEE